jgi:tetratricopeptide (TPR) repeat protein/class 3 adenylate cyclase
MASDDDHTPPESSDTRFALEIDRTGSSGKSDAPRSAVAVQALPQDQVVLPLPAGYALSEQEIAHVLFMDIVGFSKFSNEEQTQILNSLQEIVWQTPEYLAQPKERLLALPTGDGMALVFLTGTPVAAVKCAQQICRAVAEGDARLKLRMGIHTGTINHIKDVNKKPNITGDGINTAQRVMDCGDSGHILLSGTVASFLQPYKEWNNQLNDLKEVAVKHKQRVHVYSLHTNTLGNRKLPKKIRSWRRKRRLRAVSIAAASLAVVLALTFAAYRYLLQSGPRYIESMAVFPLTVRGDQETESLSDAITRDIINNLVSASNGLTIRPDPDSVLNYKLRRPDAILEAGRELQVQAVLSGTMQRVGDAYTISIELVDVRNNSPILKDVYPARIYNVNEVAGRITLDILKSLRRRSAAAPPPTDSSEAYKLYSLGRTALDLRTKQGIEQSIAYFKQAIEIDPKFADAYAALAEAYNVSSGYGVVIENNRATPKLVYPKAIAAANEALRLKPQLPEAHTALGYSLANFSYQWDEARDAYAQALRLNPENATAHYSHAFNYLISQGLLDQAIDEMNRAHNLAPESLIISTNLGWAYFYAGQYNKAIAQYNDTLKQNPSFERAHARLIELYEQLGDYPSALTHWRMRIELTDDPQEKQKRDKIATSLEEGYNRAQATGYWQKRLELAEDDNRTRYVPAYSKAAIYIMLKRNDRALDLLEQAYEDRDEGLIKLAVNPRFNGLRSDQRFINLVNKIGLKFPRTNSSNQVASYEYAPQGASGH